MMMMMMMMMINVTCAVYCDYRLPATLYTINTYLFPGMSENTKRKIVTFYAVKAHKGTRGIFTLSTKER
jgi:hypothetical protein